MVCPAASAHRPLFSLARVAAGWATRSRTLLLTLGLSALAAPAGSAPAAAGPDSRTVASTAPALSSDSAVYWLRGRVWDAYTQEPLPQASVWLQRLALGTTCDEFGYFTLPLSAEQIGQQPVDSLLIGAAAFRPGGQLLMFELIGADSLLHLTLARDTALNATQPLLATPTHPRKPARTKARFESRTNGRRQLAAAPGLR